MGRRLEPGDYLRQYAGIIRGNRRLIYINGFSPYHYREQVFSSQSDPAIPRADLVNASDGSWRVVAVSVADGYWDYFGCWYDPATGEFTGLQFNNESLAG